FGTLVANLGFALVPLLLTLATLWGAWWYVVIHQQPDLPTAVERVQTTGVPSTTTAEPAEEQLQELGAPQQSDGVAKGEPEALQQMGNTELQKQATTAPAAAGPPAEFYTYFAITAAVLALMLLYYYWTMEAERFEVLRLLITSVMPL